MERYPDSISLRDSRCSIRHRHRYRVDMYSLELFHIRRQLMHSRHRHSSYIRSRHRRWQVIRHRQLMHRCRHNR